MDTPDRETRKNDARVLPRLLYPSEPRPVTSAFQIELSRRYLEPFAGALEAYFLSVRRLLDPSLEARQPVKLGKPYPSGQCLEISKAVERAIRTGQIGELTGPAADGRAAFAQYMARGGVFRRVWGDLRGKYFQNAFQLGTLYVDVSNDTVTPTKPKVEILPFNEAGLSAIGSFVHFRDIMLCYWGGRVYPNHLLPELGPYCPLVHINAFGVATLREPTNYMIAMTKGERFRSAEAILSETAMPEPLFTKLAAALRSAGYQPANNSALGRRQSLALCRDYRRKRWYANDRQSRKLVMEIARINPVLAAARVESSVTDEASTA